MIPGAAPFGELPPSSFPEAEDTTHANPLVPLLSDPRAQLAYLMRAVVYDPESDADVSVHLSGHGYFCYGNGDGASEGLSDFQEFRLGLSVPYSMKLNLLQGGKWQASALPGFGTIVVPNPSGEHDAILAYSWELAPIVVWMGPLAWRGPSFRRFGRIFKGTVESITWSFNEIAVNIRDLRELFADDVNPAAYLGFGTAVRLRDGGDSVLVPHDAALHPEVDGQPIIAAEIVVKPRAPMQRGIIFTKGGDAGVVARMFSDGSVGLFDRGTTNYVLAPAGTLAPGRTTRLTFLGDANGIRIKADGKTVASGSTPYGAGLNTDDLIIGAGV